jgi:ABC-type Fe3+-hydroxamate transport system substrate-binding protein
MLDKFAQVYKVPERGEAMRAVRDEMVENIHAELPAQGDRPQVGVVYYNYQEESFWVYRLNGQGFQNAHTRPLRANDGLEAYESGPASGWDSGAKIDMEALLEADPDVLVQFSDWTVPDEATEAFFAIDEHPVGQELTAVQNDRLYAGAQSFQGPIMNLFQIELTAKQFYPDQFGEAPEPGNTSELGEMFDVQRVANIINGDI